MGQVSGIFATADSTDIPAIASGLCASSGNVANAAAVAALPAKVGLLAYMTGFQITGAGATSGLSVVATITGLAGGTASHVFTFPAGVTVGGQSLAPTFYPALQASAVNTAITITLPAGGLGNVNAAVSVQGFYL